jgi:hypothetical protein
MSITPEPPLKTCEGRLKHGSILNGNIWLRRVSSQWKSTDRRKVCFRNTRYKAISFSEKSHVDLHQQQSNM